jgi:hypothetical protein
VLIVTAAILCRTSRRYGAVPVEERYALKPQVVFFNTFSLLTEQSKTAIENEETLGSPQFSNPTFGGRLEH